MHEFLEASFSRQSVGILVNIDYDLGLRLWKSQVLYDDMETDYKSLKYYYWCSTRC